MDTCVSPTQLILRTRWKMASVRAARLLAWLALLPSRSSALRVCGLEVPHARPSPASRALDDFEWPEAFPYSEADLTPDWAGNDGAFYFVPKIVQHAGEECRASLTRFYECVLPPSGGRALDLCSSWTSHYPDGWRGERCVALGLNYVELGLNPSKTEFRVQDLNKDPILPYEDGAFDVRARRRCQRAA